MVTTSGAAPALPGESCGVEPSSSWSKTEDWVWNRVCVGETADLNHYFGKEANPNKPEDWSGERRLSSAFLQTILTQDLYRAALPYHGILIKGAWFDQPINFVDADLSHRLWLINSRFTAPVVMTGLRARSEISFSGSTMVGRVPRMSGGFVDYVSLFLDGAAVHGSLVLDDITATDTILLAEASIEGSFSSQRATLADLSLIGVKIGRVLELDHSNVHGTIILDSATIGDALRIRAASIGSLRLVGATIGGQFTLKKVVVAGTLNMDSATVGGHLLMPGGRFGRIDLRGVDVGGQLALPCVIADELILDSATIDGPLLTSDVSGEWKCNAKFGEVRAVRAKIGDVLDLSRVEVTKAVNLSAATIAGSLFLRWGTFKGNVDLSGAEIGANLDLRGSELTSLDLTSTHIKRDFQIASQGLSVAWIRDPSTQESRPQLVLRNTSVDAIQDEPGPTVWPQSVDLDGFTYRRFGGLGAGTEAVIAARGSQWFANWLAKDKPYTPQPYYHNADVLRRMGLPKMANDVLYAGRERDRAEAFRDGDRAHWLGLSLLNWTIGYGYGARYFRVLWWVLGLVASGSIVLLSTGEAKKVAGTRVRTKAINKEILGYLLKLSSYSLDMLLPIIELQKSHNDITLNGFARYYFYFHKLVGYVFASFLIAGLSGLTK